MINGRLGLISLFCMLNKIFYLNFDYQKGVERFLLFDSNEPG
nr:MAG TPA: hypothetical protein [Bacteriophage sp.]